MKVNIDLLRTLEQKMRRSLCSWTAAKRSLGLAISKLSMRDGFELLSLGNLRPQLKPFLSGRKYNYKFFAHVFRG